MKNMIDIIYGQDQKINYHMLTFSGGERHVQLENVEKIIPSTDISIQARIFNSEGIIDLLLLCDALRGFNDSYRIESDIVLSIPYFPYARQDRICATGQAFSLRTMANIINIISPKELIVWDIHSDMLNNLISAPTNIKNLNPSFFIRHAQAMFKYSNNVLICPDDGAFKRCLAVQKYFNIPEMVTCEKIRNPMTGEITSTKVNADNLTGKNAIIVDDICDGGYTFVKIAEMLRVKNVDNITLYVTHGIFSKGLGVFENLIDNIYTTTSIPRDETLTLNSNINFNEVKI